MNICFFTIKDVNPFVGGVERVTYNLSQFFESKGINVFYFHLRGNEYDNHFILPQDNDTESIIKYIKSKIQQYNIQIIIDQYGIGNYMSHHYLGHGVKIIRCWHLNIKEEHITRCLLETFSFKYLKSSIINFLFWLNTPLRRHKQEKYFRETVRDVDTFLLLSEHYVKYLSSKNYPSEKLYAINNAISIPEKETYKKENLIIFCGRIVHNPKNVLFLIYLWKKLYRQYPDWKMLLVGDGVDKNLMLDLIRKNDLERIEITGYSDPKPYYEKAKILVLPSYSEGFGMVLLEAMLHDCVPIVFDSSMAFRDIISDGENGFIVERLNRKEYINKCMSLMDNNEIYKKMAAKCYPSVKKSFNMEKIGTEWINLFKKLTGK